MTYDIDRILDGLPPISTMFQNDGHILRRAGANWFSQCPFHQEKSGSCKIDDNTGKFRCFGCGAGGDRIDYFRKSRGDLSLKDALPMLASMAGISGDIHAAPKPTTPRPAPVVTKVEPMSSSAIDEWHQASTWLQQSAENVKRIAGWRGYSEDVIRWAAAEGLMGIGRWSGIPREAFLVEMPGPDEGSLVPVSTHIRLGPHTKGNPGGKASWRFDPPGCGSWPFIVGNLATAANIFILEGQWDALALIDVMGWHKKWPETVAVVGLRGSTSTTKLLLHTINPAAVAFVFADADGAGEKWFDEDGFLDRLHVRVKRVHAFWPSERGNDFNDLVRLREINRDLLMAYLIPKMRSAKKKLGPTFLKWCRMQRTGDHLTAAGHVIRDKQRPKGRRAAKVWQRHWKRTCDDPGLIESLIAAFHRYRTDCRS